MLFKDYYKLKFYSFLWYHPSVVFWVSTFFYLLPAIVAIIFYPSLIKNILFIFSIVFIFLFRAISWIKAVCNFPYYHRSMEWVKWKVLQYMYLWNYLVEYIDEHHIYTAGYDGKMKNGRHKIILLEGNSPQFPLEGRKDKHSVWEVTDIEIRPNVVWVDSALRKMKEKRRECKVLKKIYGKEIAEFYKSR